MNITLVTYLVYLIISASLTLWVGRTLFKNGRFFIVEAFNGNEQAADSVNHLLLVGFYLVNFGFVSLFLRMGDRPQTPLEGIEYISTKLGVVLVVLGAMHFFNMRNISNMRSSAKRKAAAEAPLAKAN
ncbi:MAG: hypothetical protein ACXVCS_02710 [Bdellovibrionota bacterium]